MFTSKQFWYIEINMNGEPKDYTVVSAEQSIYSNPSRGKDYSVAAVQSVSSLLENHQDLPARTILTAVASAEDLPSHSVPTEKAKGKREEKDVSSSLTVTELSTEDFNQLYEQINDKAEKRVAIGKWLEANDDEFVINKGAGPCIILYFHDKTNNVILSGHYPFTQMEDADDVIRANVDIASEKYHESDPHGIKLPTPADLKNLKPPLGSVVDSYQKLMSEIKARVKDGSDIEGFVFGQNDSVSNPEELPEGQDYNTILDKELLEISINRMAPIIDI